MPYSIPPGRASTTMAPNPLRANSVAATEPIVTRPRRPRRCSTIPARRAPTASSGETRALAGGHLKSSRQSPSRAANASSLGSSTSIGWRSASASRSRSLRLNSSRPGRSEKPNSGIVTCCNHLGLEPRQGSVLSHPDGSWRCADGGGGLVGRQAHDDAQDQNLALLGGQDVE